MRRPFVVAMLFLLLLAGRAGAAYDPVGSGLVRLELAKRFATFLGRDRVRIISAAPASRQGRTLSFPASGGSFDPTIGKGEVELEGSLVFRNTRKRVPIRKLVVKTGHAPLLAKVGGSQLKLFQATSLNSVRHGFGGRFTAGGLRLSAKMATRLDKKLRPPVPFTGAQIIGTLVAFPQPLVTTILPTGRATLALDSAFVAKLNEEFVSVNPVFPVEHVGSEFTLPIIANGALSPDGDRGVLRTGGEIEFLKLGSGQVFWHELWFDLGDRFALSEIDLEPSPPYPGKVGQLEALTIDPAPTSADQAGRSIALGPAVLRLSSATADSFNHAFSEGHQVFQAGEVFASLSFIAQGQ
jgi:hypothetical protein